MCRARVPSQVIQVRRAKLRVAKPILYHIWGYPRQVFVTANILLSHARCIWGWMFGRAKDLPARQLSTCRARAANHNVFSIHIFHELQRVNFLGLERETGFSRDP